jgi:hypothetical protein
MLIYLRDSAMQCMLYIRLSIFRSVCSSVCMFGLCVTMCPLCMSVLIHHICALAHSLSVVSVLTMRAITASCELCVRVCAPGMCVCVCVCVCVLGVCAHCEHCMRMCECACEWVLYVCTQSNALQRRMQRRPVQWSTAQSRLQCSAVQAAMQCRAGKPLMCACVRACARAYCCCTRAGKNPFHPAVQCSTACSAA